MLVGLLVHDVATKQEFTTILTELKAMREASDKRFEEQRQDFQLAIKASIDTLDKSLTNKIGNLGSRWGIMAEDTFSRALSEVLSKAGFQVFKWRKTDTKAEFFVRPRGAGIDILVRNGKRIAIEVKSALGIGDIEIFERSVQFYEKSESVKVDEKIMVGIHLHREADEYARQLGIKLVSQVEDAVD